MTISSYYCFPSQNTSALTYHHVRKHGHRGRPWEATGATLPCTALLSSWSLLFEDAGRHPPCLSTLPSPLSLLTVACGSHLSLLGGSLAVPFPLSFHVPVQITLVFITTACCSLQHPPGSSGPAEGHRLEVLPGEFGDPQHPHRLSPGWASTSLRGPCPGSRLGP